WLNEYIETDGLDLPVILEECGFPVEEIIKVGDDNGRKELTEIAAYWQGKSVQGKEREYLPDDLKAYWSYNGATMLWFGAESGVPNYEKIFQVGLNGIIAEAEQKLRSISDSSMPTEEFIQTKIFLEAALISLKAGVDFGKRFAEKAKEVAAKENDSQRKKELEKIVKNCDWVPGNPPRDFYEGVQCFWFIHLITHMIEFYENGCAVRLDQLLYPLYKKDIEEGMLTRDDALELLECLFLKMDEHTQLMPAITASGIGAAHGWSTITIGGTDSYGEDASNEVSYLSLDACKALRLPQPSIAFRYHDGIPKDLVLSAIDLVHTGVGYPAFFNDQYEIPMLIEKGIPVEDARNYGIEACMRWTIPGKNIVYRAISAYIILPKFLELALNRGVDKFSGRQLGPATPDPLTFTSIDDVIDAYLEQTRFFMEKIARLNNFIDVFYKNELPRPFLSPLLDGCIEKGKDCRQWSYYYKSIIGPMGTITLADSLAAMKKLIFDEKKVAMQELVEALNNNWEGKEELQRMFLETPHFGNDDDYVDHIARDILRKTARIVESFVNYHGFNYLQDGSSGSTFYGYSGLLGATPDGRKDKDPINDGTISPVNARDKNGPTAVLKSVAKVDPMLTLNHLFNQKFLPQFLEGPNKELFAAYLKTWADLGIHHVQFNVADAQKLRDAQKNPEQYSDLVVRVAGYSAYFTDLPKGLQDSIIERTEQSLAA
ncbi:MAG: hypothetical protein B1H11_07645, partial [Desulfobacteraceae bacterium 4484_190.1]